MSSHNYGQAKKQSSIDLSNSAPSSPPPRPPRKDRDNNFNSSPQYATSVDYDDYDSKIAPENDIWNSSMAAVSPLPRATQLTPSKQLSQQVSSGNATENSVSVPIDSHVVSVVGSDKKVPSMSTKLSAAVDEEYKDRFKGKSVLRHAIWAHYLAYGAAVFCFFMGTFALLYFKTPNAYKCTLDGQPINSLYFNQTTLANGNNGNCNNQVILQANNPTMASKLICCYPNKQRYPPGSLPLGAFYLAYSFVLVIMEDTRYGFGLYYPADSLSYKYKISPSAIVNVGIGAYGLTLPITIMASFALFILAIVQSVAVHKEEAGDGGRAQNRNRKAKPDEPTWNSWCSDGYSFICGLFSCRISQFYRRILNEDKLSTYVWLFIFLAANAIFFIIVLIQWYGIVNSTRSMLLNGSLPLTGNSRIDHMYRKSVRYGPPTSFAAWAKASGSTLNMNCALILLPVTKLILRRLNNIGQSFSKFEENSSIFAKFFALPFYRYVPVSKNLEFHKLCAFMILVMSAIHIICHYCNLAYANQSTVSLFRNYLNPSFAVFKWDYAAYFTGSVVTLAMLCIYTSALEAVRMAKYELFYKAHHCFIVFYLFLFIHGPFTFYWTIGPVLLYIYERYLESQRGKAPFVLCKVDYIAPVMSIYFKPIFKKDFRFKEGQYLYLNCPYVSKKQWHPFTISSALDDMENGPRVALDTGEEVIEVPRPANLPKTAKWSKYCRITQDYKSVSQDDYLDKHETIFLDYISCHIKVHGLDDEEAKTWTRKVKEYFELLLGATREAQFPLFFVNRDARGEQSVGRQLGPDGQPILRVDGPYSAPAEHYSSYKTIMLVGAGIGLTPCVSVLTALTKYRWRKNFNPEILHFYWIVRQNEVESFQWLVHMLTEIEFELHKGRETNQIERKYYCEMNIFITGAEKNPIPVPPLHGNSRPLMQEASAKGLPPPRFTAEELFALMMNPPVSSKGQINYMREKGTAAANRLQDIWVWNGRPIWEDIFAENKAQRQDKDIGVCFCGAPVIGADLKEMCEKYSDVKDCVFTLHKENF